MTRSDFPDAELVSLVERLYREPERGLYVVGAGSRAWGSRARNRALDVSLSLGHRLRLFELELRGQLELLADQVPEFSAPEDLDRLEAEGLAVLIALRELHRHFPDLEVA